MSLKAASILKQLFFCLQFLAQVRKTPLISFGLGIIEGDVKRGKVIRTSDSVQQSLGEQHLFSFYTVQA